MLRTTGAAILFRNLDAASWLMSFPIVNLPTERILSSAQVEVADLCPESGPQRGLQSQLRGGSLAPSRRAERAAGTPRAPGRWGPAYAPAFLVPSSASPGDAARHKRAATGARWRYCRRLRSQA